MPVDGGIDPKGEDVLMVGGEDPGMDNGPPRDFDIRGLGADDPSGPDFVLYLSGLVENEGHDVLIISNGDDGLDHKLPTADNGRRTSPVVGMFPADASVLLVYTDDILHGPGFTFIRTEHGTEVMNRT